jgi:hypothetical protein
MTDQTVYEATVFASDADDTFHANLIRQFGIKGACAARYDTTRSGWDAQTVHAHAVKLIRDKDLGEAFARRNSR